jgi:hypothetical protein
MEAKMKPHTWKVCLLLTSALIAILTMTSSVRTAQAQSGGGYDLTWNVIAGGGDTNSAGGPYSLSGTIGQAEAGTLSGGSYSLSGGFWVNVLSNHLNLPLIIR